MQNGEQHSRPGRSREDCGRSRRWIGCRYQQAHRWRGQNGPRHPQASRSREECGRSRRWIGCRYQQASRLCGQANRRRGQFGPTWPGRPPPDGGWPASQLAAERKYRRAARGRSDRPRVLWQPAADPPSGRRTELRRDRRAAGPRQARLARSGSPGGLLRHMRPDDAWQVSPAPPDDGPVRRAAGNPAVLRPAASSPRSARNRACQAGARPLANRSERMLPQPQHSLLRTQYLYLDAAVSHESACLTGQAVRQQLASTD